MVSEVALLIDIFVWVFIPDFHPLEPGLEAQLLQKFHCVILLLGQSVAFLLLLYFVVLQGWLVYRLRLDYRGWQDV